MKEMCLCTIGTLAFGSAMILSTESTSAAVPPEVSAHGSAKSPYAQRRVDQTRSSTKQTAHPRREAGQGGIAGVCAPCPGDTNGDCVVDVLDLLNVINAWGNCPTVCESADHDCCTTGGPGCTDQDCCAIVCGVDPFCCDVAWDSICVNEANDLCGGGAYCFPLPTNNACADRIPIFDGVTPYHTIGATTDGPAHAACGKFGFPGIDNDIWYNYTATATGDLCVQTCGSGYDTKIAVYNGCACPVGDANLLACNDDTCALQSQVVVSVIAGNCYKIRVGGYIGASGQGQITITPGGCPVNAACPNPKHDCCTTGGPGCSDKACCAAVCAVDPFCCDVSWDGLCVNQVDTVCAEPCPSACPNPKHDCFTTGGPGCSDEECCLQVCAADPFCCDVSWDSLCVSGAQTLCIDCVADPCPAGAVLENEPCGSDTNGGCNSTPPVYTSIACGNTVCGNFWAAGGTRDTDWYQFTVAANTTVTWSVISNHTGIAAFILNNDCGNIILLGQGTGACPTVATANVGPGTYVGFVATSAFDGLPCPGAEYVATLSCSP